MNALERLIEHHCQTTSQCIELCSNLPEADLDRPSADPRPYYWHEGPVSLRAMLGKASAFAAPWMEAINGVKTDYAPSTFADMRESLARNRLAFLEILRTVERDQSWDLTFVDAVCEPPEVFSFGGVIAHVVSFNAYRRIALLRELSAHGIEAFEAADPMLYRPEA